jgi:hypothetical protein
MTQPQTANDMMASQQRFKINNQHLLYPAQTLLDCPHCCLACLYLSNFVFKRCWQLYVPFRVCRVRLLLAQPEVYTLKRVSLRWVSSSTLLFFSHEECQMDAWRLHTLPLANLIQNPFNLFRPVLPLAGPKQLEWTILLTSSHEFAFTGHTLPEPSKPKGNYVSAVRTGTYIYTGELNRSVSALTRSVNCLLVGRTIIITYFFQR